jgi:flagellar biogenesis protein FliO
VVQDILVTPHEPGISYGQSLWDMAQLLFILAVVGSATWFVVRLAKNAVRAISRRHSGRTEASPTDESVRVPRRAA